MNALLGKALRLYSRVEDRVGNARQRRAVLCSTSDTAGDRSRHLQRGVTGGQGGNTTRGLWRGQLIENCGNQGKHDKIQMPSLDEGFTFIYAFLLQRKWESALLRFFKLLHECNKCILSG